VIGDGTGTPWEEKLVNDVFGFQQAMLDASGITPSGDPDEVGASDYLQSLLDLLPSPAANWQIAADFVTDLTGTHTFNFVDRPIVASSSTGIVALACNDDGRIVYSTGLGLISSVAASGIESDLFPIAGFNSVYPASDMAFGVHSSTEYMATISGASGRIYTVPVSSMTSTPTLRYTHGANFDRISYSSLFNRWYAMQDTGSGGAIQVSAVNSITSFSAASGPSNIQWDRVLSGPSSAIAVANSVESGGYIAVTTDTDGTVFSEVTLSAVSGSVVVGVAYSEYRKRWMVALSSVSGNIRIFLSDDEVGDSYTEIRDITAAATDFMGSAYDLAAVGHAWVLARSAGFMVSYDDGVTWSVLRVPGTRSSGPYYKKFVKSNDRTLAVMYGTTVQTGYGADFGFRILSTPRTQRLSATY
jgi:hypothetical protein